MSNHENSSLVDRQLLINFRMDPAIVRQFLPVGVEPRVIHGFAIGGICVVRLNKRKLGPLIRIRESENVAHRFAICPPAATSHESQASSCVYVCRAHTSSRWNSFLGNRILAGRYHRANIDVEESPEVIRVKMTSRDKSSQLSFSGVTGCGHPMESIFSSIGEALRFLEQCSIRRAIESRSSGSNGISHRVSWKQLVPLRTQGLETSFFYDESRFPAGSIEFDSAFILRSREHVIESKTQPIESAATLKPAVETGPAMIDESTLPTGVAV